MSKRDRLSGNEAIATAMRQISPDVFAAFPITPSTEIPQYLSLIHILPCCSCFSQLQPVVFCKCLLCGHFLGYLWIIVSCIAYKVNCFCLFYN